MGKGWSESKGFSKRLTGSFPHETRSDCTYTALLCKATSPKAAVDALREAGLSLRPRQGSALLNLDVLNTHDTLC